MFARPISCSHTSEVFEGEYVEGENWPYFTCGCRADIIPKERFYVVPAPQPWRKNIGVPRKLLNNVTYKRMVSALEWSYFMIKKSLTEDAFSFNVICKPCMFVGHPFADVDKVEREEYLTHRINARCFPNNPWYSQLQYKCSILFYNSSDKIVLTNMFEEECYTASTIVEGDEDGNIFIPVDSRPGHQLRHYMVANSWSNSVYREPGFIDSATRKFIDSSHKSKTVVRWPTETHCRICDKCVFTVTPFYQYMYRVRTP